LQGSTTGYPTLPDSSLQHLPRIPTKEKRGATKVFSREKGVKAQGKNKSWDGTEVIQIPGTQRPFTLAAYKAEVDKSYQTITVFICLKRDFEEVGNLSDLFDSDPEIVIKKSSEFDLADTLLSTI
ncbi:hypothetical protein GOODEAATRI_020913, partial [Goodea atripinnis]